MQEGIFPPRVSTDHARQEGYGMGNEVVSKLTSLFDDGHWETVEAFPVLSKNAAKDERDGCWVVGGLGRHFEVRGSAAALSAIRLTDGGSIDVGSNQVRRLQDANGDRMVIINNTISVLEIKEV